MIHPLQLQQAFRRADRPAPAPRTHAGTQKRIADESNIQPRHYHTPEHFECRVNAGQAQSRPGTISKLSYWVNLSLGDRREVRKEGRVFYFFWLGGRNPSEIL